MNWRKALNCKCLPELVEARRAGTGVMPHMKDFNSPLILIHAVEDPNGRMDKTANVRVVSNRCTHARERFQEVDVIEKSAYEPFRVVGVKFPRPTFDRFKVG